MSTLQEKAAEAKAKMERSNPSTPAPTQQAERTRIPMSLPTLKMAVPEIPGYHLHWFRGTPQRLMQAQQAGYEFVHPEEVQLNPAMVGGDATHGNTDLGTRVSMAEGSETEGGQAVRMYLMKQRMEYWLEDQKILQDRNDSVAAALTESYRQGMVGGVTSGERPEDVSARYVDQKRARVPDLFKKKAPR